MKKELPISGCSKSESYLKDITVTIGVGRLFSFGNLYN